MPNKKINALDVRTAVATDLMLVGDPTTGTAYKSTLANLPLVPSSRTLTINGVAFDLSANRAWTIGTVTSVGLTMPSAFGVANSPITSSGTLAVTALGTASQYIRGDGVLATLPTGGSGGSSVSYYLNGGTAASVGTYYQMSTTPVVGTNADFTRTGNGLISQFLTDVGDPNRLQIPAGNWNFEMFFSMSSSGGTPEFYVELLKYDGTTFTSIASSSAIPEVISGGTIIDLYLTSLAIPATTLLATDRLALRVYIVNNSGGRTATLHTQDSHLCQIITNFAGGVSALNGLTANTQYFATGTSGTNFAIVSSGDTHTFNLPTASATNRGALSSADWTTFNNKVPTSRTLTINGTAFDLSADRSWTIAAGITGSGVANQLTYWNGTGSVTGSSALTYNDTTGVASISKSVSGDVGLNITNGSNGSLTAASIVMRNNANDIAYFGKASLLYSYKTITGGNGFVYTQGGDLSLLCDQSNGKIKFAAGAVSTAQMTLTSAGRLLLGTTTEGTFLLDVNGTARVSGDMQFGSTKGIEILVNPDAFNGGVMRYYTTANTKYTGSNFFNSSNVLAASFAYADSSVVDVGLRDSFLIGARTATGKTIFVGGASATQFMTLTAAGRLLIGTTSESTFIIDANGTGRISNIELSSNEISYGNVNANKNIFLLKGTTSATRTGLGFLSTTTSNNGGLLLHAYGSLAGADILFGFGVDTSNATIANTKMALFNSTGNLSIGGSADVASALIQMSSTTKGFLPPRMTTTQRDAIASPATGLVVYQTDGTEGLYEKTSSAWRIINGGGGGSVDELQVALLSQVYG